MQPIEIFRTGSHTSMQGQTLSFGESDLAAVASSYDPSLHHAPIVVGHPSHDAPAYGWVDALAIHDGRLVATPGDVDPAFADLVAAKRYAKVSASFYRPAAPNNPVPGSYYLRHVGFLGAQPPAVKGLKPITFADDDSVTVEFSDWDVSRGLGVLARVLRSLRDWMIAEKGVETANQVVPDWEIQEVASAASAAVPEPLPDQAPAPAFADAPNTPTTNAEDPPMSQQTASTADLEQRAADLAAREASFAEREAAHEARERQARKVADTAFVGEVVQQGRLPVGLQPLTTALFAELGEDVVSFADGDEQRQSSPREMLRTLLTALPQPVETRMLGQGAEPLDFADTSATTEAINAEVAAARAEGRAISPAEALGRLRVKEGNR